VQNLISACGIPRTIPGVTFKDVASMMLKWSVWYQTSEGVVVLAGDDDISFRQLWPRRPGSIKLDRIKFFSEIYIPPGIGLHRVSIRRKYFIFH
jgi:hypothetical protein